MIGGCQLFVAFLVSCVREERELNTHTNSVMVIYNLQFRADTRKHEDWWMPVLSRVAELQGSEKCTARSICGRTEHMDWRMPVLEQG